MARVQVVILETDAGDKLGRSVDRGLCSSKGRGEVGLQQSLRRTKLCNCLFGYEARLIPTPHIVRKVPSQDPSRDLDRVPCTFTRSEKARTGLLLDEVDCGQL